MTGSFTKPRRIPPASRDWREAPPRFPLPPRQLPRRSRSVHRATLQQDPVASFFPAPCALLGGGGWPKGNAVRAILPAHAMQALLAALPSPCSAVRRRASDQPPLCCHHRAARHDSCRLSFLAPHARAHTHTRPATVSRDRPRPTPPSHQHTPRTAYRPRPTLDPDRSRRFALPGATLLFLFPLLFRSRPSPTRASCRWSLQLNAIRLRVHRLPASCPPPLRCHWPCVGL